MISNLILNDFIFFLRNINISARYITIKDKVRVITELYINLLKISFIFIILSTIVVVINKSEVFIDTDKLVRVSSKTLYAFLVLIVGPIYEELSYRYFLTKFEKRKFIISSSLLLSYFLFILIKSGLFYFEGVSYLCHYYGYLFAFGVIFYISLNLIIRNNILLTIRNIWDKYFYIIFYIVSFLFVINHLIESMYSSLIIEVRYMMLIPLLIYSLMVGFVRIKLNFTCAILFHILFNLPSVIIKLFVA